MTKIPSDEPLFKRLLRVGEVGVAPVSSEHLDEESIALFAEENLPPAQREALLSHLADCRECRVLTAHVIKEFGENEEKAPKQIQSIVEKPVPSSRANTLSSSARRTLLATAASLLALVAVGGLYWANSRPTEATAYHQVRERLERGKFSEARALVASAEKNGIDSERLKSLDAQALREIPAAVALERAGRLSDFGYDLGGVVARDPTSLPHRRGLAAAEQRLGKETGNDLELLLNRGHLRLTQGNIAAAREDFAAAEKFDPASRLVHLGKGLASFLDNDFTQAQQHFRRAADLDPRDASAKINLAMTLEELGKDKAALEVWHELLQGELPQPERERIRTHVQDLEKGER